MGPLQRFSSRLHSQIAQKKDMNHYGNFVFSPVSMFLVTLMLMRGANGPTKQQLYSLVPEGDYHGMNAQLGSLPKEVLEAGNETFLELSNTLLVNSENSSSSEFQSYTQSLMEELGSTCSVQLLDVTDTSKAVQTVNELVSLGTRGHIKEIMQEGQISSDTQLLAVSAAYFEGKWLKPFDEDDTQLGTFYRPSPNHGAKPSTNSSLEPVKVQMMTLQVTDGPFYQYETEKVSAVGLPYTDPNFVMFFVQPKDPKDLRNLISPYTERSSTESTGISTPFIEEVIEAMVHESGHASEQDTMCMEVEMPKFSMDAKENRLDLKELFLELGVELPFASSADFSGIMQKELFVSSFVHEADIMVYEKGTVASAVTLAAIEDRCLRLYNKHVSIKINKPFAFQLWKLDTRVRNPAVTLDAAKSTDHMVLFSGQVTDPSVLQKTDMVNGSKNLC